MRNIDEDAETVTSEASGAQPAWMKNLVNSCQGWLNSLPDVRAAVIHSFNPANEHVVLTSNRTC